MKASNLKAYQTPLEDLRESDLKHYNEASTAIHHWSSGVPTAINFYYNYKRLSLLGKLKYAFKKW